MDPGEIAIGEERLCVLLDEREVKAVEQVVGTVAAAYGCDDIRVGIGESCMQVVESWRGFARKKKRAAGLRVFPKMRSEAEITEMLDAAIHAFLICERCRRDHSDGCTLWQMSKLI